MSLKTCRSYESICAIGIDLGGTGIKSGIADFNGKIIASRNRLSPVDKGARAILNAIIESGAELIEIASKRNLKIVSVGVGSPGGIDVEKGIVLGNTPNIPDWGGVKLRDIISKALNLPCAVDNDANLFMLAESLFGAARGCRNAIGLTLGTGIGSGLLIDGKIYHGSGWIGGEIGHVPIVANGRKCKCGLRGCLEVYASAPALVRLYKQLGGVKLKGLDTASIFNLAKSHDEIATLAVEKWCDYLAWGIASAVNLLNPEAVILGGGVAEAGNFLKSKVENAIQGKIIPVTMKGLKIKIAELGNKAGWLGASAHALASIGNTKA